MLVSPLHLQIIDIFRIVGKGLPVVRLESQRDLPLKFLGHALGLLLHLPRRHGPVGFPGLKVSNLLVLGVPAHRHSDFVRHTPFPLNFADTCHSITPPCLS